MGNESFEKVEPVFGQAEGEFESDNISVQSVSSLRPFLFSLLPKDSQRVRLCASDFHAHTWQAELSIEDLLALREDVGIGGSWAEFLAYLRAALLSKNVKLLLGGAASGHGATTARLVGQKSSGTPRLSLSLRRLEGPDAEEARASLSFGMFHAFQELSSTVSSEREQVRDLKVAIEQAKVERLQEKQDSSPQIFPSRRKLNRDRFSPIPIPTTLPQQAIRPSMQLETQDVVITSDPTTGTSKEKKDTAQRASVPKSRVLVIPASRRAKRRGTAITEETDS